MAGVRYQPFWEKLKQQCEVGVELDQGKFDLEENIRFGSCLGTAEGAEYRAYSLVLVEMDETAEWYFEKIRTHALAALAHDESFDYEPVGGKNLFGQYMALRIAASADKMLDGGRSLELLGKAVDRLERAVSLEFDASRSGLSASESGPLLVHYSQLGKWSDFQSFSSSRGPKALRGGSPPWASIAKALCGIAEEKKTSDAISNRALNGLNRLVLKLTDVGEFESLHDPRLTVNDVISLCQIRAELVFGISDPWKSVKAIRDSSLLG